MKRKNLLAFLVVLFTLTTTLFMGSCEFIKSFFEHTCAWSEWEVTVEATCTEQGERTRKCECGETQTEAIEAMGHSLVLIEGKEATCFEHGYSEKSYCDRCNEIFTEYSRIEKLGHDYMPILTEIVDKYEQTTYECTRCFDQQVKQGDELPVSETSQELFNCSNDFTFKVKAESVEEAGEGEATAIGETYLRENLRIIDAYFFGSEYENRQEIEVAYELTDLNDGTWEVSVSDGYESGMTYVAVLSEGLAFADYYGSDLTFSIKQTEEKMEYEADNSVVFLRALENDSAGYYPYSLYQTAKEEELLLRVGKTANLSVGDVVCMGEVISIEEVLEGDEEVHFGKIKSITQNASGSWDIVLTQPEVSEVFAEFDAYMEQELNFDELDVEVAEDAEEQIVSALYANESFGQFLGAVKASSASFLEERGLSSEIQTASFLDKISIRPTIRYSERNFFVSVDGRVPMDVKSKNGAKIGTMSVYFDIEVEANFVVDVGGSFKKKLGIPVGIQYFKCVINQNTELYFDFGIEFDIDYSLDDGETEYVKDTATGLVHYKNCRNVNTATQTAFESLTVQAMIAECKANANGECELCKPYQTTKQRTYIIDNAGAGARVIHTHDCSQVSDVDANALTVSYLSYAKLANGGYTACASCSPEQREQISYSEHLTQSLKHRDWEEVLSVIKQKADQTGISEKASKKLTLCTIPTSVGKIKVNFVFNFDIQSVMATYRVRYNSVYGIRYEHNGLRNVSSSQKYVDESTLTVMGKAEVRVGLGLDLNVTFMKVVEAGVTSEIGAYAQMSGIVQASSTQEDVYNAGRLELGVYASVRGYYGAFGWKSDNSIADVKTPVQRLGYDKAYYAFVNPKTQLEVDGSYTLTDADFLSVQYLDLTTLTNKSDVLSFTPNRNANYTVLLSFADGSYCYIENGATLKIKCESPAEFTDTLIVTVAGVNPADWLKYYKNSSVYYLQSYSVKVTFSGATSHSYQTTSYTAPTCTQDGYEAGYCVYCGDSYSQTLEKLGHSYTTYVSNGDATCTEDGTKTASCDNGCGTTDTVVDEGSILEHTYTTYVSNGDATCTQDGTETATCDDGCGTTDTRTEVGTILNHNYVDGVCSSCERVFGSEGLEFTKIEGKEEYAVTGIGTCTDTDIVIPVKHNGLPVTSIGANAFKYCTTFTSVEIPNSVTSIGANAFYYCDSLTSVKIPDSVTSIGDEAFYCYTSLTSVYISDIEAWCKISFGNDSSNPLSSANNLYLNNEQVTELIIPNTVTEIKAYAFYCYTSLTSIEIPNSVTSIGAWAFEGCSSLTSVKIPDSVTSIGEDAFYCCTSLTSVVIGDSVTSIGANAFYYCDSLTSVKIPDSVTSIGDEAFYSCTSLTSVVIGDSVTSIGNRAFYCYTSLTSVYISDIEAWCKISFGDVSSNPLCNGANLYLNNELVTELVIPNTVTEIKAYAFYYCSSLTSVEIPNSVTSIGELAFCNCSSLTSIEIPDSVTSIGDQAFYNCYGLISVEIPNSVTSIGYGTFYNCSSLTSIKIPDGVTSIGNFAFSSCDSLTSVEIGNSVTSIGYSAFNGCDSLTSVEIPDSVTSIGLNAFFDCDSLTSVVIGDSVTSIGLNAFFDCDSLTSVTFKNPNGWFRASSSTATSGTNISSADLSDTATAATYLKSYYNYYWKRSE